MSLRLWDVQYSVISDFLILRFLFLLKSVSASLEFIISCFFTDIDVGPSLFSIQLWFVNDCFLQVFSLIIWCSSAIRFCFCLATEFSYLLLNSHYSSFFDHILLELCYDTSVQRRFYKCSFFLFKIYLLSEYSHCKDSLRVLVLSALNNSALCTIDSTNCGLKSSEKLWPPWFWHSKLEFATLWVPG